MIAIQAVILQLKKRKRKRRRLRSVESHLVAKNLAALNARKRK